MTDEEWVDCGSLAADAWYARVQADFGIDARPAGRTWRVHPPPSPSRRFSDAADS